MLDVRQTSQEYLVDPYCDYSSSALVEIVALEAGYGRESASNTARLSDESDDQAYAYIKRAFDIAFAATFIVVALPFLILLAIVLQIDSPGSAFFVQQRIGRHGKPFKCFKFRTMHVDADRLLREILAQSAEARAEWEADHKLRCDPRVSRFGKIVRKLSLDELPQLINILRGEMSVVGPRPIIQAEIPKYGSFFADYCAVKPGLTGLWQVSGRNDVSYDQRVQLDVEYRRRASTLLDLTIIAKTVPAVVFARGSY